MERPLGVPPIHDLQGRIFPHASRIKDNYMKVRKIGCPYCGVAMKYIGTKRIQLGKSNIFFEHLDNWLSGALPVSIYECPTCSKLEFFRYKK